MKNFDKIEIKAQSRRKTTTKQITEHIGYDTETLYGYCRLICDSYGNYLYFGDNPKMSDNEILTEILDFLYRNAGKNNSLHWFYNLNYDFRAIIKYLPSDMLIKLYNNNKIEFNGYTIEFLESKFFRIGKNKHYNTFYDVAHYYSGGLDKNAEKYLNDNKIEDTNREILGTSAEYWQKHKFEIIDYCIHDCELTANLAKLFYRNLWNEIKFNPKKPYSAGNIAQTYFLQNAFIPTIHGIPQNVLREHQNYYRGGRIEVLKRGFFPRLMSYDIKSAYPSIMTELLDYGNGNWIKTTEFDDELHGLYKIRYQWLHDNLGMFAENYDNMTVYPNVISKPRETWINEKELIFLSEHENNAKFDIIDGFQFIPYYEKYPYRETILNLFEHKEHAEKENDENKRMIYKLFINSIYGKTAEAILNKKTGKFETGQLYNPIYANRITSLTRLKLIQAAYSISDHVIGFNTDSILCDKPISDKFISNRLGMFTHEYNAIDSVVLMAGIRYIKFKDGNKFKIKQKMRGFKSGLDLKNLLELNPTKAVIETHISKPITLFQGLVYDNLTKNDINIFTDSIKMLDLNGDMRRFWQDTFINAADCLKRSINSFPIPL